MFMFAKGSKWLMPVILVSLRQEDSCVFQATEGELASRKWKFVLNCSFKFFCLLCLYMCVHIHHGANMKIRELCRVSFLFPPFHEVQGLNSGCQTFRGKHLHRIHYLLSPWATVLEWSLSVINQVSVLVFNIFLSCWWVEEFASWAFFCYKI